MIATLWGFVVSIRHTCTEAWAYLFSKLPALDIGLTVSEYAQAPTTQAGPAGRGLV